MADQNQHIRKRDRIRGIFNRSNNVTDRSLVQSRVQQPSNNAQGQSSHVSQPRQDNHEQSNTSVSCSSNETRMRILENATKNLGPKDREIIEAYRLSTSDISNVLSDVYDLCKKKEQLCGNKRWTFAFHGRKVKLKDQVEQVIKWMDRFKQVGDIAANASPLYAGLPWAGVRVLLEAMTVEKSTVGALIVGLETVSYMMTRLDIYLSYLDRVQLPQAKKQLEQSLTRFYKMIMEFLVRAIPIFQESTVSRTFSSLWRVQDILHFETRCDELANRVELDAQICDREEGRERFETIQNQLSELKNLRNLTDSIGGILVKLNNSECVKILQWVSQVSYIDNHYAARKGTTENTANWIFGRSEYQNWESSPQSMILWLHGIPGAGKTKLTASVVHRFLNLGSGNNRLAYFYCNRNEESRRDPLQVLCCFIKQLSREDGAIHESVVDKYREKESTGFASKSMSYDEAEKVLLELLQSFSSSTTLVLDALDECFEHSRRNLMRTLNGFAEYLPRLKIFISSRRDDDIKRRLEKESNLGIEAAENQNDIATFVRTRIEEDEKDRPRPISDEIKNKIVKMLLEKSEGMFQWAFLQTEQILKFKREQDIRDYLYRLPKDLTAAYHQIFERIEEQEGSTPEIAIRTFQWIIGSIEPLETSALVVAVCQDLDKEVPQDPDIDMELILSACQNLVVTVRKIDNNGSESWTCQFSHLSVREYLEDQYVEKVQESPKLVAKAYLLLLLNSSQLQMFLETIHIEYTLMTPLHRLYVYAILQWPYQTRAILSSEKDSGSDVDALLRRFFISGNAASENYKLWFRCMERCFKSRPKTRTFTQIFRIKELFKSFPNLNPSSDVLLLICAFGLNKLLKDVLDIRDYNADESKPKYSSLLILPAQDGNISCARLLIEKGADINTQSGGHRFGSALTAAAYSGGVAIVQLLLDSGADINMQVRTGMYGSALVAATSYFADIAVVQLLLDNGADVNMQLHVGNYGSALAAASCTSNIAVVQLLLDNGADVNMQLHVGGYGSALAAAVVVATVFDSNTAVVQLLLDNGADVNMQLHVGDDGSALAAAVRTAASRGNIPVAQLLLDNGADINMQLRNGRHGSVLAAAVSQYTSTRMPAKLHNITKMVQLLVDNGADVNSGTILNILVRTGCVKRTFLEKQLHCMDGQHVDISGRTTLHFAALGGDVDVFEYLRSVGFDPAVQDFNGYDCIDYACIGGSLAILKLLLDNRSLLNSRERNDNQWTPLHWAFRSGLPEMIEILVVEQGFRNNTTVTTSQPDMRWSPVSIAIIHENEDILEKLSDTCKALLGLTTSESSSNDNKDQATTEESVWLVPYRYSNKICAGCFRSVYGPFFHCVDCGDDIDFCFMCKSFLDIGHSDHNWKYIEQSID